VTGDLLITWAFAAVTAVALEVRGIRALAAGHRAGAAALLVLRLVAADTAAPWPVIADALFSQAGGSS
jgi:hypothetical protein